MVFVVPLNFEYWFITFLAGSTGVFLALMFVAIAGLSAMFRMPMSVTLSSFALFSAIMWFRFGDLLVLTIVLASLFVFWGLARLFKG